MEPVTRVQIPDEAVYVILCDNALEKASLLLPTAMVWFLCLMAYQPLWVI